jgi:hypothetical protein
MTVPDILRVDIEIYDENSRMLGVANSDFL